MAAQSGAVGDRVWELAIKALVPVTFIIGAAMVRNEVVDAQQTQRVEMLEKQVDSTASRVYDTLSRIEAILDEIRERIAKLEATK